MIWQCNTLNPDCNFLILFVLRLEKQYDILTLTKKDRQGGKYA